MNGQAPNIIWFRRDLRLADHPALRAAASGGRAVVAVFIRDGAVDDLGAAPRWRLEQGLAALAESLEADGSRLILRSGPAREVLEALVKEVGAGAVYWTRLYDPQARERDSRVKAALRDAGIEAKSFPGHLLFEPWTVATGQGGYYKVYSPYWRAVKNRDLPRPCPKPELSAPERWPESEALEDWALGAQMRRGAAVVGAHVRAGETAARRRFGQFLANHIADYAEARDMVAENATSGMSEYLSLGEVSPLTLWHESLSAEGKGAETFRKELVWREFAYHLMFHVPHMLEDNWREGWNNFPWNDDERRAEVKAWKQGRTGEPLVDAAMREMYVTGRMHNRARMIVASYLCKHLLCHWRIGQKWFEDCLVDWDPASNAMGWQWVAGSGPDAAPYFRVFNPETQAAKFDPDGTYRRRWIAEGQARPTQTALEYFDAVPESWTIRPGDPYPDRIIGLKDGRDRALRAYETIKS